MRVLFITNIPSPYRVDFFNELGKLCDLTVSFEGAKSTERNDAWKSENANNFQAIYLRGIRTKADEFFCPSIIEIIKRGWDKIIIGMYSTPTSMFAIQYLRNHRIDFILETDGGFIKTESKIRYLIKKYFISAASAWLVSGEPARDYFVHYGANKDGCYTYPFTSLRKEDLVCAETIKKVPSKEIREKLGIKEEFIVLSVGRFSYEAGYGKGYDVILKVAEMLINTNIGYYIVGDDPTDEFLRWKDEKGLENVHFLGFKKKEELALYYAMADVFVLMTKSDVWGLVVNEAMMYGLPVITTDMCIAGRELIKENVNGFIISVGDSIALMDKILILHDDIDMCHRIGAANKEKIKEYTVDKMAICHKKLLERY